MEPAFIRAFHCSLSWARSIQRMQPQAEIHFNIIYSPTSWSSYWFSSQYPLRVCIHLTHSCYMPCPSHYPDFIILITVGEGCKLWSSLLCSCFQPPVSSSLFRPYILLSVLLANTFSLYSSVNIKNQVSHPYKTTGKIIVLNVVIFTFSGSWLEHDILNKNPQYDDIVRIFGTTIAV
jgi:hypothetical protein